METLEFLGQGSHLIIHHLCGSWMTLESVMLRPKLLVKIQSPVLHQVLPEKQEPSEEA